MTRFLGQLTFNVLLAVWTHHGIASRAIRVVFSWLRQRLIQLNNPIVRWNFDGKVLYLPLSHDLPFNQLRTPHYDTNLVRIVKQVLEKYPNLAVIDIGANIGDTAANLRREVNCPILCVEGNQMFLDVLRMNLPGLGKHVYIEPAFVGATTGAIKGRVAAQAGTSRIVVDDQATIQTKALRDILVAHEQFMYAKFIKIDTDGFDCLIIRASLDVLRALKPIVFFEYDPFLGEKNSEDYLGIFEPLRQIGYATAIVFENTGEYLLSADLKDQPLLEDIYHFYRSQNGRRYCDICVLHGDDSDLVKELRRTEITYFSSQRVQ